MHHDYHGIRQFTMISPCYGTQTQCRRDTTVIASAVGAPPSSSKLRNIESFGGGLGCVGAMFYGFWAIMAPDEAAKDSRRAFQESERLESSV